MNKNPETKKPGDIVPLNVKYVQSLTIYNANNFHTRKKCIHGMLASEHHSYFTVSACMYIKTEQYMYSKYCIMT